MSYPPYTQFLEFDLIPSRERAGVLIRVPLDLGTLAGQDPGQLVQWVQRLRRMLPHAVVCGVARTGADPALQRLLARAGMRFLVPVEAEVVVIRQLAARQGIDRVDVESWLRLHLVPHVELSRFSGRVNTWVSVVS